MRVAILTRVSTAEQAEADRLSLDAQERAMREKCARLGWTVVSVFTAPGESAYTDDLAARPVLARALLAAERGEFDALMVYDVSRFARDQSLAHQSSGRLRKAGVALFDTMKDTDYTLDRFWFGIEAAVAEHQSHLQGQKVSSAKAERFRLGLHNGDVPFGYTKGATTKDPLVPVPAGAAAIREAFHMRAAGAGYQMIADWLNHEGLRPHSKQGIGLFGVSAVQSLLEQVFYYGIVRFKAETKRGAHEPVITEDEWLRAQAVIRRQRGSNRRVGNHGLLSGLVRCSACGDTLHGSWSKRWAYYVERSRGRGRDCVNTNTRWRVEEPDGAVSSMMEQLFTDRDWHNVTKAVRSCRGSRQCALTSRKNDSA